MDHPHSLERYQRPVLLIGIAALGVCAVGGFFAPAQFFRSYLFAFLFWAGVALGCMAVAMLHHVTGGGWGLPIRRPLESATRTLPLLLVLFLPIILGAGRIYEWADPAAVAHDPLLKQKSLYLNVPFFTGRAVLYFAAWIGFRVEDYPFGLLTMIVSLEAIFLSTFVMISQNRADAKRQVLADHQWKIVQTEEKQNEELLTISNQILAMTKAIHELANTAIGGAQPGPTTSS